VETIDRDGINQYLTFKLGDELFAITVANIKEVLEVPRITHVPRMPEFLNGVFNLRGNIIPLLDLKMKFGIGQTITGEDTGVIVTEIGKVFKDEDDSGITIGLLSDEVQKVVTIEPDQIQPPPRIGVSIDTGFIIGMGELEEGFVIILNIDRILSESELVTGKSRRSSL